VVVTAFSRSVVDGYTAVLESAGLMPIAYDIEASAIARSVVDAADERTYIVVNLKHSKAGLYIVHSGVAHFTSTIELPTRAASGKQNNSDAGAAVDTASRSTALTREIKKLVSYWNSQAKGKEAPVAKVILCGEKALEPSIAKDIVAETGLDAEEANVWRNAFSFDEYIPDVPKERSLSYAAAVGLALPSFE